MILGRGGTDRAEEHIPSDVPTAPYYFSET